MAKTCSSSGYHSVHCVKMLLKVAVITLLLSAVADFKIFDNCELRKELLSEWPDFFNKENVDVWVCIAKYESTFNTSAVSRANWDDSNDYGLFQINSRYWCGYRKTCQISCEKLLDDDLSDDIECVKEIDRIQGLTAWSVYNHICKDPEKAAAATKGCDSQRLNRSYRYRTQNRPYRYRSQRRRAKQRNDRYWR